MQHVMRTVLALFLLLCSTVDLVAEDPGSPRYLSPMDLRALAAKAAFHHSPLDIGAPAAVFDGKLDTLIRTPAVNPLAFRVDFPQCVRAHGMRLQFSGDEHRIRLFSAAEPNLAEKLIAEGRTDASGVFSVRLPRPLEAKTWRLEARRLTGDDFVHLLEWEFLEPGEPGTLIVTCREPEGTFLTNIKKDVLPDDLAHPCHLKLFAYLREGNRPERDVTSRCVWSSSNPGFLKSLDRPGTFASRGAGHGAVKARFMGLSAEFPVSLVEARRTNRTPDLDVAFIERLPGLPFDGPKGWPEPGETVTFRAHLIWWGDTSIHDVEYAWRIDDRETKRAVIPGIEPDGRVCVDFDWTWRAGRHAVTFLADPADRILELTEDNNRVRDVTDALTVGFWVDRGVYDHVHEHRFALVGEGNSFDDWAQHMVRTWNRIFETAMFPSLPGGVSDRVRLGKVVVVPADALPLNGGIPTNNPDTRDHTVDLMWGFPSRDLRNGGWSLDLKRNGWLKEDLGVLHELGHARYLVDAYGFDVHKKSVHIRDEAGRLITEGGRYMPDEGIVHWRKYTGQMGGGLRAPQPVRRPLLGAEAGDACV